MKFFGNYSPSAELTDLVRPWALKIEKFSISPVIVYITSHDNQHADVLSRGRIDTFKAMNPNVGVMTWPASVRCYNFSC